MFPSSDNSLRTIVRRGIDAAIDFATLGEYGWATALDDLGDPTAFVPRPSSEALLALAPPAVGTAALPRDPKPLTMASAAAASLAADQRGGPRALERRAPLSIHLPRHAGSPATRHEDCGAQEPRRGAGPRAALPARLTGLSKALGLAERCRRGSGPPPVPGGLPTAGRRRTARWPGSRPLSAGPAAGRIQT